MALTFSQITSKINKATGANDTSYSLADKAVDVNLALDEAFAVIFKCGGTWQFDDGNHTKDPIITADLVSGQRDYHFLIDEQSNIILDIFKVQAKDSNGVFHDLTPVDMQRDCPTTMTDGQNLTGTPTVYDKTGNGIFLDLIPNYNSVGGLRVFISREASYFISTDTTKKSGIDGLCHDYLYLKPAYDYARDKGLENREALYRDLDNSTKKIKDRYGTKERDIKRRLIPIQQDNR